MSEKLIRSETIILMIKIKITIISIRPYGNKQKERTYRIVDFAVPLNHRVKLKECEKKDKYLDLARGLKKLWNKKVAIIPIAIGAPRTVTKSINKGTGGLGNKRTGRDYSNYSIVEIGQNTEMSPGDLRRLVVTQNPVKNFQLTLMWKLSNSEVIRKQIYVMWWQKRNDHSYNQRMQ